MKLLGIDYSMTSPAFCIFSGDSWKIQNCTFYYMTPKNKHLISTEQVKGTLYPEWKTYENRFDNLSSWIIDHVAGVEKVRIEGYSYGSTSSRLFNIGENTGILKYKLWKENIDFDVVPPTVVKKFATGKGNSNKEKMWDSFIEETGLNLFHLLGQEEKKNWNPVSDMVDSYYITKGLFLDSIHQ